MSLLRRRFISSNRFTKLPKGPRRKGAAPLATSRFGIERLEDRWTLSASPVLTFDNQLPDPAVEASPVDVSFDFTDLVESGGAGFGLNAAAHAASTNGVYAATANILVNTTTGMWSDGGLTPLASIVIPSGGHMVRAFVFDSFTLGAGFTLTAIGDKPLAILSQGAITINGTIDLRPQEVSPGASHSSLTNNFIAGAGGGEGGQVGTMLGKPGAGAPVTGGGEFRASEGGGGGGHGGAGGNGSNTILLAHADGGVAYGTAPAQLGVITGGSGGGAGNFSFVQEGGDGGGAIELGALGNITIGATGKILADGGFGEIDATGNNVGGGGGAGGGILIHGKDVVVSGQLSANGGAAFTAFNRGGGGGGGRIVVAEEASGVTSVPTVTGAVTVTGAGIIQAGMPGQVVTNHSFTAAAVNETYSYYIDFGNGDIETGAVLEANITRGALGGNNLGTFAGSTIYADNPVSDVRQVIARIADSSMTGDFAGTVGVDYIQIVVNIDVVNVAPTLAIAGAAAVDEGDLYTLSLSSTDPGVDTISQWSIDWGDGSVEVVAGNPSSATHTYADGASNYTISALATDEDGSYAAGNTVAVAVENVAPTLVISGAAAIDEGSLYTLTLASSDPGDDTIVSWEINWGDGAIEIVSGNPASVTHTYADGDETWTVSATATDEDETFVAANTVAVDVLNVSPLLAISGASTVAEAALYTLGLSASDPGADTIQSWEINWGDGNLETITGNPASVTHIYADGNATSNYTILATATDEDGTFTANSLAVSVLNVNPTADAGGAYVTFDDLAITLTGTGSDVAGAADPLSYSWDLDNNGSFETTGATVSFDPEALGIDGTQVWTVQFKVTDGDGGEAIDQATVQIYGKGTYLLDGILYVIGDKVANDIALISQFGGDICVLATFNDNNPAVFAAADVTKIVARTRGGHDVCVTTSSVTEMMTIEGGDGNDLLVGGCGENFIYGGAGHDTLYGGCGNDMLFGGDGDDDLFGRSGTDVLVGGAGNDIMDGGADRDLLIGGLNEDWLHGGTEDDILIGGYTSHDNDLAALDAIMAIWTSSASFADRVATLTGPGGYLIPEVTVFDDDAADHIIGAAGRDLAFADTTKNWDGVRDTISLSSAQDTLIALN